MPTPADLVAAHEAEVLDDHPDAETAALEKCKHASHLRVVVEVDVDAHDDASVFYLPNMACRNDAGYHGWGALITTGRKTKGIHLFPDAVHLLAEHLPVVADEARATGDRNAVVSVQHKVEKTFTTWRSFTADEADAIAGQLATLVP